MKNEIKPNTGLTVRQTLKKKNYELGYGDILPERAANNLLKRFGLDPYVYGAMLISRRRIDTICDYIGLP